MRSNLEALRKRLSVKLLAYDETAKDKPDHPLFNSDLVLAVPNIIMRPTLDEIQQLLNSAVSAITSITKTIYRWGQPRNMTPVPPTAPDNTSSIVASGGSQCQSFQQSHRSSLRSRFRLLSDTSVGSARLKNFHRHVSEHKEIQKIVSALSTAINSTKQVVVMAIDHFSGYTHLWRVEREVRMRAFLEEESPGVNEFRVEMDDYAKLADDIATELDELVAGTVCLSTEKLKLALTTEMRAWVVSYGRAMNHKYQTVMEEVFCSIDDWTKRLARPLKDLDDIRSIMATLKEIRENEIKIDMSLDPIEVSWFWRGAPWVFCLSVLCLMLPA